MSEEAFKKWVRSRGGDPYKKDGQWRSSMTREWAKAWEAAQQQPSDSEMLDWLIKESRLVVEFNNTWEVVSPTAYTGVSYGEGDTARKAIATAMENN